MKGFQNIFFYDLFGIWIRFPFILFMASTCGYVFLMVLDLFFYDLFMALEMVQGGPGWHQNQVLWREKASGKGKL